MIDIHTHILPGICDGAKTIEESIKIIKEGTKFGVTDFVMTPHYILGTNYNTNNLSKIELIKKIKKILRKEKIKANIYIGNEVFIDNNVLQLKEANLISTLNNSNYLLNELPLTGYFKGLNNIIFELLCNNVNSIIAHPERYSNFHKDPKLIEKLIEQGVYFQCNIGSFFGEYGKSTKKLVMLLLKHKAITFISSDIHHAKDNYYEKLISLEKILKKYLTKEEIEDVLVNNAKKVLNNEPLEKTNIKPFKKTIFGKWK